MSLTIIDIAREAGVSKSTVSLVIQNSDKISAETKYKVRQAIEKLGYVPNLAARELTTNKAHTLGLVFFTANHLRKPYAFDSVPETLFYDTYNGICNELQRTNYTLLTERFSFTNGVKDLPYIIKQRRLDGLFLIGGLFVSDFIDQLKVFNIPSVIVGRTYEGMDCVSIDADLVGYKGVSYLAKNGHKNIVFVNGPLNSSNSALKYNGAVRAAQEAGDVTLKTVNSGYTGEEAYQAFKSVLDSGFKPDAVLAGSDGITAGVLRLLYERRLYIPEDISVIGYENSLLSAYSPRPLTVIDAQKEKMGEEACRILLNRINKPRSKEVTIEIEPNIIEQGSVKRI